VVSIREKVGIVLLTALVAGLIVWGVWEYNCDRDREGQTHLSSQRALLGTRARQAPLTRRLSMRSVTLPHESRHPTRARVASYVVTARYRARWFGNLLPNRLTGAAADGVTTFDGR